MRDKRRRQLLLVLYLFPFLALIAVFAYVPLFGWAYAFFDYKPGIPIVRSTFVGLKYFRMVFSGGSDFWAVLINTLSISLLNILCSVIPVIFAIMISQVRMRRFSKLVQTLTSIPNFISWVVVYSVVFMLIASEDSALNTLLRALGFQGASNVLVDADRAWFVQVSISVWKTTGYNAILYLAAISGIDQELYDAAAVDGCNAWHRIRHVTIPGIMPTFFVLLLLSISNMLSNGFEQFWLFGNGMTWDKLEVFDTYVYRMGIRNMEYSFSTALGIFKSIVSIVLLTIANFASKRIRGTSIF
jgi:ABC-type polysaccharide transport system permease subunit